ncbi:MAG: hypothetical protein ACREO8_14045 [Luteimonas sp.]
MQRGALFTLLAQAWPQIVTLHRDTAIDAIDDSTRRLRDACRGRHGRFDLVIAR